MNTTETTLTNRPNYRVYDRTGGGVTYDIYAESLQDAIKQGREWIEGGNWDRGEMETPLDCCVRQILYVPDLSSLEIPGIRDVRMEDGVILAEMDFDIIETIKSVLSNVRIMRLSDPDEDGEVHVSMGLDHIPMTIDEAATDDGDSHDCSGVCPAKDAPECEGGEDHVWESPYDIVGGCKENPGVFGSGRGSVCCHNVCAICGLHRSTDYGAALSHNGQQATRISYEDADETTLDWAKPKEVKVNGVTVALDWDEMTAACSVPSQDLKEGCPDGPSDGEVITLPSGREIRLGDHDYSTDQPGQEDDDECTCTASFERCA